jgi:hypothetical protein
MPKDLREMRILRMEDTLLSGYALLNMGGMYRYIDTLGEIRHYRWPDSSQSQVYQSHNLALSQMIFVGHQIERLFGQQWKWG